MIKLVMENYNMILTVEVSKASGFSSDEIGKY